MTELIIIWLSWLAINIVTRLSWKLKLSKTYISIGLSILVWVILYVWELLVNKYPAARESVIEFVLWSYSISQIVYNIRTKINEQKK